MLESLFYALCTLLALFGIYHVFDGVYKYLMCKRNDEGIYTVIFHFDEEYLLPDKVYSALLLTEYKTLGKREVYVIDRNYSENTKIKCRIIVGDMGRVHFIKSEDLRGIYKINTDND